MADDIAEIQGSLEEIKAALLNKKKDEGQEITTDVFTDPRFIEIFENYFKPLIDSSKIYKDRLTEKKKISVFDVIGISERTQEQKRNALTKEIEKITEKLSKIGKNLGNVKHYNISDVLGLSKTERTTNRRIVNNAIRTLSLNINKTAKNIGDVNQVMKFMGLKSIKIDKKVLSRTASSEPTVSSPVVEPPVVIREKKKGKKSTATVTQPTTTSVPSTSASTVAPVSTPVVTPPVAVTPPVTESLAEKEKASMKVTRVAIVDLSENVKDFFRKNLGGSGPLDKGKGTGEDRESYSHSMNALARLLTLGAGLLATGIAALISGLFDTGPLKGLKKMVGSYSLQMALKLGKGALHYLKNLVPHVEGGFGSFISKSYEFFIKGLKVVSPKLSSWFSKTVLRGIEVVEKMAGGLSKFFTEGLAKGAAKAGLRGLVNRAGATGLRLLGKALGKIPFIGALISIGFAMNRFANGDIIGGLIDLASGAASTIPVVGTAVSIALDIWNATRDIKGGGPKQNASKGWNKKINDFFQKTFKKLLYGSIIALPFGDKIAKMLGISDGELSEGLDNSTPDTSVSPEVQRSREKMATANKVRFKAETRKQEILKGRELSQLSEQERAEYQAEDAVVKRASESIAKTQASVRGAEIKKEKPSVTALPVPTAPREVEQRPTAEYEQDAEYLREQATADAAINEPEVEVTPNNTSVAPREQTRRSDETLDTLKQMNSNLEEMNARTSRQTTVMPAVNPTNVITAVGGGSGGGSSPLLIALETVRDTAYVAREKARNMILDYRAIA